MPEQPEDPDQEPTGQEPTEQQRRRNKWIMFGVLVVTAIVLYVAILIRFYKGG